MDFPLVRKISSSWDWYLVPSFIDEASTWIHDIVVKYCPWLKLVFLMGIASARKEGETHAVMAVDLKIGILCMGWMYTKSGIPLYKIVIVHCKVRHPFFSSSVFSLHICFPSASSSLLSYINPSLYVSVPPNSNLLGACVFFPSFPQPLSPHRSFCLFFS